MSSASSGMTSTASDTLFPWLTDCTGSFLGSQANPWTIDEADMIPDSDFLKATAEEQDDDASSESNISLLYDDDLEVEEPLDIDTDENEEVEDIDDDEEESEVDDHDSEDIAESPIYTPKSPRYIPDGAESYSIDRDYTSAQYGNETGYLDGPFAYSRPSWASTNNHAFIGAPQPWETEVVKQPARPTNFPMVSPPTEKLVPQYPLTGPSNPTLVAEPISRTTTTRDLIDENRRAYSKADMSIHNLINPSPSRESHITGTKRKAEFLDLDLDEETLLAMVPKQTVDLPAEISSPPVPAEIESDKLPQTPESLNKEHIETSVLDTVALSSISAPAVIDAEPPRKKQKLRAMMNKVAIFGAGVMVGSAGMLGGLMSLPDGFFQS